MIDNEVLENIKEFNIQDYLKTPKDVRGYLKEASKENDLNYLITAITDVIKSDGCEKIIEKKGITKDELCKNFSDKSDVKLETVFKILNVLGLRIEIKPMGSKESQF
mgnify:CR=1 FL=1